jgi:hypothetical protein
LLIKEAYRILNAESTNRNLSDIKLGGNNEMATAVRASSEKFSGITVSLSKFSLRTEGYGYSNWRHPWVKSVEKQLVFQTNENQKK